MEGVSREVRLVAPPPGLPSEDRFEAADTPIPDPADGELLVRNAYLSVDPYMRPRMNDVRSYVPAYALGEAMTGDAVGRVGIRCRTGTVRRTGCGDYRPSIASCRNAVAIAADLPIVLRPGFAWHQP